MGGPSKSALLSWLSWIVIAGFGAGVTMLLLGSSGTDTSQVDRVTTVGAPVAKAKLAPPPPVVLAEFDDRPVAGFLIDSAGAPVVGATVTSVGSVGMVIGRPSRTSDDGSFRLASADLDGATQLRIDGDAILPAQLTWQSGGPPPRIIVARRISLLATVTRAGAAASGVEVHLRDGGDVDRAVGHSDEHGLVRFADLPAGTYELWAGNDSDVSGLARVSVLGGEARATLDLAPASSLTGALVVAGTIPAGSTVTVVPTALDHVSRTSSVAANGGFQIAALPAGEYRLYSRVAGFVEGSPQLVSVAAPSKVVAAPVTITLVKVGRAQGKVVDDNGQPIPGATIVLRNESGNAPVSSTASGPRSRLGQWVHPLAGSRQMPIRDTRRFGAARPPPRPAECGLGHCGVDLGTERGKIVHAVADGVVVSVYPELRGAAGRYVALLHAGGLRTQYMHLAEVRADLVVGQEVLAGTPIGIVGTSGVHVSGPHLHFSLAQELGDRTWYLDPEALLQNAVVLPDEGTLSAPNPAAGVVRIATIRTDDGRSVTLAGGARTFSDTRGEFIVDELAPGRYAAMAVAPGYTSGVPVTVMVASGALSERITIVLGRGVMIAGQVRGPAGAIAGARVSLETSGAGESVQVLARAITDGDGRYSLVAPRGEVTLVVAALGYGERERGLDLRAAQLSDAPRNEDFELGSAAARLHGEVLDEVGVPAAGVIVRIVTGPTTDRRTRTNALGQFRLDGVASGQFQVELLAAGRPATTAALASDSFTSLRLRAGGSIDVLVLDHHTGRALAGVVIHARGTDGVTADPRTDSNGQASLRGLLPGTYRLRVDAPGYVGSERTVKVLEGPRAEGVRLELARGATVAGTVRDGYGQRVAGARVWLGEAETRTDRDGNFRMTDVPTGAGTLRAERDDERGSVALTLSPGDETLTLTVNLQ